MYNYLKCKYDLNLEESISSKIDRDWEKITFLCDPILGKVGEFLIRGNGELCHSQTEYETVDSSDIGQPGVIWNGTKYARIKSSEWVRVDYNGKLKITTQIIAKQTDATMEIVFDIKSGYVFNHVSNVTLIDNTERLEHDKKIKKIAIKRAEKLNSTQYRIYDYLIRKPMKGIYRLIGHTGSFMQELAWKLERKLNK